MICEIPIDDLSVAPQPHSSSRQSKNRMLVIEDDVPQADILAYRFGQAGFQVERAYSGREGLRQAANGQFDVVLLDIDLPDLNGLTVCESLSDGERTCGTPVILVSGMDDADIVRRSRSAGAAYFVRKPVDPNVLWMVVQQALGESPS